MTLAEIWFVAIAVLWIGFFVLEGFDFGVGMLLPILGRKEENRRVMINTIGPVWDGNETWLIAAGGAMFAAFPEWYATMFSGLYLPLFLVLVGLIVRGVSFEYRHKRDSDKWRRGFDACIISASIVVPLVLGIGFANFVRGLPIVLTPTATGAERWIMDGSLGGILQLFTPFALLGGLMFLALFLFHGAIYIALKTRGDIRGEARAFAAKAGVVAIALVATFLVWSTVAYGQGLISWIITAIAVAGVVYAWAMNARGAEGRAFAGTAVGIIAMSTSFFVSLFPNVIKAIDPAYNLSIQAAASTSYTLTIMTISTVIFLPVVIAYQAWTFWVFRKRISTKNLPVATH